MENRDYYNVLASSNIENKGVTIRITKVVDATCPTIDPNDDLQFVIESKGRAILFALELIFVTIRGLFIHEES